MISVNNVGMYFGPQVLFENVNFLLTPGERYGVVGANGAGKSTFFKIITGEVHAEVGEISIPNECRLGTLNQNHFAFENDRIIDVVVMGNEALWKVMSEKEVLLQKTDLTDEDSYRLGELESEIASMNGYSAEADAAKLLEGLGIPSPQHPLPMSSLSGGYKLRVLLAQVLFSQPEVLMLDEPTNHLDFYSIRWLETFLTGYPGTVLIISHDHDFLNAVCTQTLDVDYGTIRLYTGNYDAFLSAKDEERIRMEKLLDKQQARKEELEAFVTRFRAKASKARQAQSKERMVGKLNEEIEANVVHPSSRRYPSLNFTQCRPSGIVPLVIKGLGKSYGEKTVLADVSVEINRGEKVAIIGPNGVGKSTLLNVITGHTDADCGEVKWGYEAHWNYFPQDHHQEIHGKGSVLQWLWQWDPKLTQGQVREVLARALFVGDDVDKDVENLSGGEMARLLLARMMIMQHNILIFDEPTNHLDLEAIEALAKAINNYDGTLLLVSHNRYFVSHIADRILEIQPNGLRDFTGGYDEFLRISEADHLSREVNLKARSAMHKQEEATAERSTRNAPATEKGNDKPAAAKSDKPKVDDNLSHAERKKRRNRLQKLKRSVEQAEGKTQELEAKIAELDKKLGDESFFASASVEDMQRLDEERNALQTSLDEAFAQWEADAAELEELGE